MRHLLRTLVIVAAAAMASCQRYEVELYYSGTADVGIDVDWESRFGQVPDGMTIMLARDSADDIVYTDITNHVGHYDVQLEPGTYRMLIFNNTTGEFGSMRFYAMRSFSQAYAYAQQLQRTTDFWDVNVSYMREPEAIACAVDTFTVLPEMTDGDFRFVPWRDKSEGTYEQLSLREVPELMTTELFVRVKVIGYKYMAAVEGNLSGMADGFLLTQAWRRSVAGYHLLDSWQATAAPDESDSLTSVGYISTRIATFGLPHGRELVEQRDPGSCMLSLCFTLIDGTQHVFRYPVGKVIRYRTDSIADAPQAAAWTHTRAGDTEPMRRSDVTLQLELLLEAPFYTDPEVPHLPYAQPSGTGAFDAHVADWGDEQNIEVTM